MSQPIDNRLRDDDVALRVGRLMIALWQQERTIAALAARVDELDPPEPPKKPPDPPDPPAAPPADRES